MYSGCLWDLQIQEHFLLDAVSISPMSQLPQSECLYQDCPRYTEHMPKVER